MFSPTGYYAHFRELTNGEIQEARILGFKIPHLPVLPVILATLSGIDNIPQPVVMLQNGALAPPIKVAGLIGVYTTPERV